jgi:hypothetical protein
MKRLALLAFLAPSLCFAYPPTPSVLTDAIFSYAHAFNQGPQGTVGDTYSLQHVNFPFNVATGGCIFTGATNVMFVYQGNDPVLYSTTSDSGARSLSLYTTQYNCQSGSYVAASTTSATLGGLATSSPNVSITDCFGTNLAQCTSWLFTPSALTVSNYSQLGTILTNKPPFGYFPLLQNILGGATTSVASTTLVGIGTVAGAFAPLRLGLSAVLYLALLLWLFHRLRKFQF